MQYILLVGAIFNFVGGVTIFVSFTALAASEKANPSDYALHRLFTGGTALTFFAMYLYLFLNTQYVWPFLLFGMCLKFWAFVASLLSHRLYGLLTKDLIGFGVANLVLGLLFAIYLFA